MAGVRLLAAGGLLAALLVAAGCGGPKTVTVTGTVTSGGKPVELSPTGALQVTLFPAVEPPEGITTYPAHCEAGGNFTIEGVPPGTYKVIVEQLDPTPQVDKLGGAFSMSNTKITREVDGKTPLTIDLADPGS
jgi:hypothetical protein